MPGNKRLYNPEHFLPEKLNFFHKPPFAIGVLVLGFLVTITAWYLSNYYLYQKAADRFDYRTDEIRDRIIIRMNHYEQAFKSGVALFNSGDFVSRDNWKRYISTLDLQKNFPGIQAIGFSYSIPEGQVDSLEQQFQREGFENFKIYPSDISMEDHAIIYIEPFDWRNRRAFGFNMFSEKNRREAMSYARDSATSALSKKVILVQETNQDVQQGFLMYFPVYKNNSLKTVSERRKNLYGFVYGAFRVNDFMEGILNSRAQEIDFAIYDGDTIAAENLLFQNTKEAIIPREQKRFSSTKTIEIAGHTWTIAFNSKDSFISRFDYIQPLLIAFAGIVIELILFYLIWSAYSLNKYYRRVKTEAEENANNLRIALSAANMGSWELDLRERTSRRSLEHDKIFGYKELQPKWNYEIFIDHVLPKHRAMVNNAYEDAYKTGKLKVECQLDPSKVKSERWIYIEGEVTSNFAKKPARMHGIVMDISDRKKAEQAIRESEERFKFIADASPVMIYMIDQEGKVTYYNKTMKDFIGYSDEDVTRKGWEAVIYPQDMPELKNLFVKSLQDKKQYETEFRIRREDGKYFWFMSTRIPRYTSSGEFVGYVGSAFNIHDRKIAEEELKEKQQMLESSNQDLNTFIYSISHDIKNPLTALVLHSQLAEDYSTIEEYKTFMEMVKRKSETIQEIIDVMSNVIREENKDKTIENIDLEEEVKETLNDYKEITSDINANIYCNLQVNKIQYIKGYIRSILLNLIGNAIKYRDHEKQLNIEITTSVAGEFILLAVKDNGIGIDLQEAGHKLFKPFQRVAKNTSGSGLGLFIIKRMIQKNGGKIKVESAPEKGTTFLCYIKEYEFI